MDVVLRGPALPAGVRDYTLRSAGDGHYPTTSPQVKTTLLSLPGLGYDRLFLGPLLLPVTMGALDDDPNATRPRAGINAGEYGIIIGGTQMRGLRL